MLAARRIRPALNHPERIRVGSLILVRHVMNT